MYVLSKCQYEKSLETYGMHLVCAYSPDLTPCDFWLFPKLRGCCYETTEEMKEYRKEMKGYRKEMKEYRNEGH